MRIAMPVNENALETTICISFGRTPYFLVYETETKEAVFIENTAADSQGGAGIKAAQLVVDENVGVLLTPRCGENAADVIQGANIQIFKTVHQTVKETIEAYEAGQLLPLNEIHSGFHHHGAQ